MEPITEKPKKAIRPSAKIRYQEIHSCFNLLPNSGFVFNPENIGGWKSSFYKELRELRRIQSKINPKEYKGLDYIGMIFEFTNTENGLSIWKER